MIKAKITKNIMRKSSNSFGLSTKQIVITVIAFAIGVCMYFLLRNFINFTLLSTLIFCELAGVICFGVINIQGMSLWSFFVKSMKGADVRYYETEGLFSGISRFSISKKGKK